MEKEKNCYSCKFRGTVPGSAHSSCRMIRETTSDKEKAMELELLLSTGGYQLTIKDKETGAERPLVSLNEHGVKNGWAAWPLNFDPVWVEDCVLFQGKE